MPRNILIVDDSLFQRNQIVKTVKELFEKIDQAQDGAEALSKAKQSDYDMIITDLVMPNMDGLQFLKELRKTKQTPVIVITADIQEPVKQECVSYGVKAFVNKPFKPDELINILRNSI